MRSSSSPDPPPAAQRGVHPRSEHRHLGERVVVEVGSREHVHTRLEVDHAHRPGVVDLGNERAVGRDPDDVDRVVAAGSQHRQPSGDVVRVGADEQRQRDLAARTPARIRGLGLAGDRMAIGHGADRASRGHRQPGASGDEIAAPHHQRARAQDPGRSTRAGDELVTVGSQDDRRVRETAPGQQDRAHRANPRGKLTPM